MLLGFMESNYWESNSILYIYIFINYGFYYALYLYAKNDIILT
jgi:hypothetical protein